MNDGETRGSGTPILPLKSADVKSVTFEIEPLYPAVFHAMPSTAAPAAHAFERVKFERLNFLLKKFGPTASTTQWCWTAPRTNAFGLGIQMSATPFPVDSSAEICVASALSTLRLTTTAILCIALNSAVLMVGPVGVFTE